MRTQGLLEKYYNTQQTNTYMHAFFSHKYMYISVHAISTKNTFKGVFSLGHKKYLSHPGCLGSATKLWSKELRESGSNVRAITQYTGHISAVHHIQNEPRPAPPRSHIYGYLAKCKPNIHNNFSSILITANS